MTRERAKELMPVIEAYAAGKEVQYKNSITFGSWITCNPINGPQLDKDTQYRIAPEPEKLPLGPDDVTSGACWVRHLGVAYPIEQVREDSIRLRNWNSDLTFKQIANDDYTIRINGGPWRPAYREGGK